MHIKMPFSHLNALVQKCAVTSAYLQVIEQENLTT
jgi:hypothetical protein